MSSSSTGFQSAPPPHSLSSAESALAQAMRLLNLIESEFDALKKQDLAAFELIQPEKLELLTQLDRLSQKIQQGTAGDTSTADWNSFKDTIRKCQDGYRRNETLIARQLMTIRGALRALSGTTGPESVEMYDRLGQLTNHARRDRYNEA